MRAPTLQRWVHFREVGGGLFMSRQRVGCKTARFQGSRCAVPTRRAQRREILRNFVVDTARTVARMFTCPGDVAQLGERLGRIEEVEGSIPFVSTTGF